MKHLFLKTFILTLLLLSSFQNSFATVYTSVITGSWEDDATWSGTGIPGAGDTVIIEHDYTVIVTIPNAICSRMLIGTVDGNGTLAFDSFAAELTVTGETTVGALLNTGTIDMSAGGTFIAGSWILANPGAGSFFAYGTGTVKFTTTFTLPKDINFNSFYNLEIESGTTSLDTITTVYGTLTMSNTGVLDAKGKELTVKGNWTQSGTASFIASSGEVTLNGSGDQYITHTSTETFSTLVVDKSSGKLIVNNGSVSITTLLTITSGTVDLGTHPLNGTGGLTMTNGDLQIAELTSVCSCTLPGLTGTYNISGGTVTFKGEGGQTIRGATASVPIVASYNDVIIKGSGTKTLEGDLDVNGSLSILDSAELDASVFNRTIFLAGDWINTSVYAMPDAFNERNGNVIMNGVGSVSLTAAFNLSGETFYDLTMAKSGGTDNLTLNNAISITHQLTLTVGHIITSPVFKTLTIETTAIPVAGGNNDSFVDGPVIKKTASTDSYLLPTGKITPLDEYHWIEITPSGNTATTYIAEYFYTIPSNNTDVGPDVNRVSELEEWTLQRPSGTEDAKVELSWTVNSVVNTNTTDLLVVQDDGTPGPRWINKCTCITSGTITTGSIQTVGYITLFGTQYPITLGSPHLTNNELGHSRYSVADGNWDNAAVWATRSGGPAGASVPDNEKRVIIEAGKRVDVNVAASALKLTMGNNGNGTLDFNATTNDVIVGNEGILINANSDVEGTNTAAVLRTTGDIAVNSDISVESSDGTTPSNYVLLRETTGNKVIRGTGTVTHFTNNASTILIGSLTVKQSFSGTSTLQNAGTLILKGTVAQITANMLDVETYTPNTIEYDNTIADFDFSAKGATYHHLVLSGASVKQPSLPLNLNGNLLLNAGVILDQDAYDNDILIKGDWTNLGATFIPSSSSSTKVAFRGASEQNITSAGSAFKNVDVNNASPTGLVLKDEMSIANGGKLTLTDGYVFLGNNNLVLKTGHLTIDAPSAGSFVVTNGGGALTMETVTASRKFPIGSQGTATDYTPVTLDNTGGTPDTYSAKVCNNINTNGNCAGASLITTNTVNKTWNVSEAVAGGSNVTLTLQWNAIHELTGFDRSTSFISHHTAGSWKEQQAPGVASGSGPFTKTVANLTGAFSPFGIGSVGSPLPVELLEFNALLSGDAVRIDWITASEKNNDYFDVERTKDGILYTTVATLKGAGTSERTLYYSTIDNHPLTGTAYYRLKQMDFDGSYSFSNLIQVDYEKNKTQPVLIIYPNPAYDKASLLIQNVNKEEDLKITIYDIAGKLVYSKTTSMEKESENVIGLDFSGKLDEGIYFVVVHVGDYQYKQKLIMQSGNH